MAMPQTHGIREFHQNQSDDAFTVEQIRNIGFAVIDSGFTDDELQVIRDKIDAIYERQLHEFGGPENLATIRDADIARCLVGYDDYFLQVAVHPRVISTCEQLIGQNVMLMSQNGIINRPSDEHFQVTWHRDLNYQHFVSSSPLAVSALFVIDAFSDETGGTHVLPGTHKVVEFPSPEYVALHEQCIAAPSGAIILFDAMLFHRAGLNRSGAVRRAINLIFTPPLIKQQISLPHMLRGRFSDDPFLRRFLGYDTQTGESVQAWRTTKLEAAR